MVTTPADGATYIHINVSTRQTLQKTVTIKGEAGKQIKIESLSCSLAAPTSGKATAWIIGIVDGKETELARWTTENTIYTSKSESPAFLAEAGKDVILKLHLLSSSSTLKAKLKKPSYTYSFETVEEPEEEEPEEPETEIKNCIMIICSSAEDVENMAEDLKAHVGDRKILKLIET